MQMWHQLKFAVTTRAIWERRELVCVNGLPSIHPNIHVHLQLFTSLLSHQISSDILAYFPEDGAGMMVLLVCLYVMLSFQWAFNTRTEE